VISFVGSHQIIAARIKFEVLDGVKNAKTEEHQLGKKEQPRCSKYSASQPGKALGHKGIVREPFNVQRHDRLSDLTDCCWEVFISGGQIIRVSPLDLCQILREFGVRINLLHVIVVFQGVDQLVHRSDCRLSR